MSKLYESKEVRAVVTKIFEQHYYRLTKEGFTAYRWPPRIQRENDPMLKITVHPGHKTIRFQYRDLDKKERIPIYYLMIDNLDKLFDWIEERALRYMNIYVAGENLVTMKFIRLSNTLFYHVFMEPNTGDTLSVTVDLIGNTITFNFHNEESSIEVDEELYKYLTASKLNQNIRLKYLDRRSQYFLPGVCRRCAPIPQGAYNIARRRWGYTADVAYDNFMLEVINQCAAANIETDIIPAIANSNKSADITEHYTYDDKNIDALYKRGFYGTKAFYSLTGDKYAFKTQDEADRYIDALMSVKLKPEDVGHNILGLSFIYLLELYEINSDCLGGKYYG